MSFAINNPSTPTHKTGQAGVSVHRCTHALAPPDASTPRREQLTKDSAAPRAPTPCVPTPCCAPNQVYASTFQHDKCAVCFSEARRRSCVGTSDLTRLSLTATASHHSTLPGARHARIRFLLHSYRVMPKNVHLCVCAYLFVVSICLPRSVYLSVSLCLARSLFWCRCMAQVLMQRAGIWMWAGWRERPVSLQKFERSHDACCQ